MRPILALLALPLALLVLPLGQAKDSVLTATGSNFESIVTSNPFVLMEVGRAVTLQQLRVH